MNISMWSSFFYEDDPETMLAKLVSCGYRHTELSFEHGQALLKRPGKTASKAGALVRHAADHGIAIPQAHLSYAYDPMAVDEKTRASALDSLKQEMELYMLLGIKAAVLHVGAAGAKKANWPRERIDEVRIASLQTLCAAATGSGMRLALENLRTDLADASALLCVIEQSGCRDGLGICLDTGHLNLAGGDSAQFVNEAGDALIALHIADNLREHDDHLFPFGGTIRWSPFLATLRASRYDGLFNFEVPGERIFEPAFPGRDAILLHKARYGYDLARLMLGVG
jgi:sugar phosphate isomerase/epimerase